jgi:hypothetical protein
LTTKADSDDKLNKRNRLTHHLMDLHARAAKVAEDLAPLHDEAAREEFAALDADASAVETQRLVVFRHVYASITCWAEAGNSAKVSEALGYGREQATKLKREPSRLRVDAELDRLQAWARHALAARRA